MSSVDIVSLAGPLLVGVILEWGLLGALTVQLYNFSTDSSLQEKFRTKLFVCIIYALSLTHSVISFTWAWKFLVVGWGDPLAFLIIPWQESVHTILTGVMATIEHCFFCWRLWALKRESTVVRCVVVLVLMLGISMYGAIVSEPVDIEKEDAFVKVALAWLSGSFTADIIVAISMILVLKSASSNAHSARTQHIIQKLMIRTVETGSITAIAALVVLILFQQFHSTYIYMAVAFLLCNLYSNVILANINGRKTLTSDPKPGYTMSLGLGFTNRTSTVRGSRSHELAFRRPPGTDMDENRGGNDDSDALKSVLTDSERVV
ncbi:hypothetical protein D9757_013306 [Collybiopsis confluens]|uniref:DUF6534 domain-containing protein n=1 Tax=Collybiopsis confluens TaxID=2823264 RepID=A0A8H5CRH7_9AGAR|nr:hypothetical protein D9757_013306 [Collybiopsis confluens]